MFLLLMGHLWGDYMLQNKWMATNKSKNIWICFLHSIIYTLSICVWTNKWTPIFFALIFLSHFPLDFWEFGKKWLHLIKGRDFLEENNGDNPYKIIHVSFSTLVYVIVDNTMHLTLMVMIYQNS